MFEFKVIQDDHGEISCIETNLSGENLLGAPKLNKGTAFTQAERDAFGLTGLLPYQVETLEQQSARMYGQYQEHHTDLGKNIYLNVLHDYNETLFFRLVSEHLEEMLPIVYTPTVGEAVQRFSAELRKPRGLYISYPDRNRIDEILDNRLPPEVDLAIATDGEAVLGIGDQGIGGINISNAKLMVYTLCGGLSPHRLLPIQLDVGTNNEHLLNDPMYLGWRNPRIQKEAYDSFIDQFVSAITKKFPNIFLHWEDVGRENGRRILNTYSDKICTFNDDMQGTGVVTLATILAGVSASGIPLEQQRIVIMGAGTAGVGIADQIFQALTESGLTAEQARAKIWLIDRPGLLLKDVPLLPFQAPYAHTREEVKSWNIQDPNYISLYDVVYNVKPSILIGSSTVSGAFSEEIVKIMATNVERPIIMPLSNPNFLAEATPEDLIRWTQGKAIIATGSPFKDVMYDGKWYRIAQCNNALGFPGIGLGAIVAKAKHVTEGMLRAATQSLSDYSPVKHDKLAPLLPKLSEAKMVSFNVALAVAEQARKEGFAQVPDDFNFRDAIKNAIWEPRYYPYRKVR